MEIYKIPMNLRAAYLSMHRMTNAHLSKHGVTADQFVCLSILFEKDGLTQKELVQSATSDPNTIRAMLVLLENQGFIARDVHPEDGRARMVKLTEKGRQMTELMIEDLGPVRDMMSAGLSEVEADQLNRLLSKIPKSMAKQLFNKK
jgi:DNA-binding MarR family transcriptional regulator